jgi:TIR domain
LRYRIHLVAIDDDSRRVQPPNFLSYNSVDHSFVENIAQKLRDAGLTPFLDRWYLAPGER